MSTHAHSSAPDDAPKPRVKPHQLAIGLSGTGRGAVPRILQARDAADLCMRLPFLHLTFRLRSSQLSISREEGPKGRSRVGFTHKRLAYQGGVGSCVADPDKIPGTADTALGNTQDAGRDTFAGQSESSALAG